MQQSDEPIGIGEKVWSAQFRDQLTVHSVFHNGGMLLATVHSLSKGYCTVQHNTLKRKRVRKANLEIIINYGPGGVLTGTLGAHLGDPPPLSAKSSFIMEIEE